MKRQSSAWWLLLLGFIVLKASAILEPFPPKNLPPDLQEVADVLEHYGFKVRFADAPIPHVFGLFQSSTKTLWVTPAAFKNRVGREIFLHEVTHAAQSCPAGILSLIGWTMPLSSVDETALQVLLHAFYTPEARPFEAEARRLADRSDAPRQLITALRERCSAEVSPRPVPRFYHHVPSVP